MLGETLFSQLFQLNADRILALCWQNSCLAPEFHQSRLQCSLWPCFFGPQRWNQIAIAKLPLFPFFLRIGAKGGSQTNCLFHECIITQWNSLLSCMSRSVPLEDSPLFLAAVSGYGKPLTNRPTPVLCRFKGKPTPHFPLWERDSP